MNEILKDRLKVLSSDEIAVKALRELFRQAIQNREPKLEESKENNLLGEEYRAYLEAKNIINNAFLDLDGYQDEIKKTPHKNRGV
jgi:hypothetical protein